MTTNPKDSDMEMQRTEEAWARLQSRLAEEPVNPKWSEWNMDAPSATLQDLNGEAADNDEGILKEVVQDGTEEKKGASITNLTEVQKRPTRRKGMSRRSKWAAAAAGVALFAAVLASPAGNTAMASILSQFKVKDVAVVQEEDVRNIFYQMTQNGEINQSMNRFGEFSNTNGTYIGELPVDQLQDKLGYAAISGALTSGNKKVTVGSSQDITLNLNVDEVNKALKRLGAEHLLPNSIDGKPITLHIPEIVNYDLTVRDDQWASFSQMNTPVLTVDPSVKVEEALDAVINFPLLPEYLKTSLVQSRILSGDIPLPLIAGENTEQVDVKGIPVIVDHHEYSTDIVYSATWVQNGQLFSLSGEEYSSKDKLIAKVQELMKP